MAQRVVRCRCR